MNETLQTTLLAETEALLSASSEADTVLVAVNAMAALVGAGQAVMWRRRFGRPSIVAVAGIASIERHTDFTHWFELLARQFLGPANAPVQLIPDVFDDMYLRTERGHYLLEYSRHLPLRDSDSRVIGGIFVARSHEFSPGEIEILGRFAHSVFRMLTRWQVCAGLRRSQGFRIASRFAVILLVIGVLTGGLMMPVRQSAIGNVEVSARDAMPITATQDGVIERVLVRPNQQVRNGTPLVRYDGTVVRSKLFVSQQTVGVAQAELDRATGKAFGDENARAELRTLRARVEEKSAETGYLDELAHRLEIRSTAVGVAIFRDAEEWTGRSVQSGERIMMLADPGKVWLTLYVPVEEAIPLGETPGIEFSLDIDPLRIRHARVVESAYEAVIMPDGRAAYLMHAVLEASDSLPRIGLKGVARIYGERSMLGYLLIRKPLRALRRLLGW